MKYYTYEKTDDLLLIRLSKKGRFWYRLNRLLVVTGLSLAAAWILSSEVNVIEHKKLQYWILFIIVFILLTFFFSFKSYQSLRVDKKKDVFVVNESVVLERINPLHLYRREIISAEAGGVYTIKLKYMNRNYDLLRGVGNRDALEIMELLIVFLEQDPETPGIQ